MQQYAEIVWALKTLKITALRILNLMGAGCDHESKIFQYLNLASFFAFGIRR
jgi:hypothetical protein